MVNDGVNRVLQTRGSHMVSLGKTLAEGVKFYGRVNHIHF
jgi:hypothetical protein